MFKRVLSIIVINTFIILISITSVQAASSGAFNIFGSDSEALGKGNAFTGEADNPSAVYFNPAGLGQIEGTQVSLGTSLIKPLISHTSSTGVETEMRENKFFCSAYLWCE